MSGHRPGGRSFSAAAMGFALPPQRQTGIAPAARISSRGANSQQMPTIGTPSPASSLSQLDGCWHNTNALSNLFHGSSACLPCGRLARCNCNVGGSGDQVATGSWCCVSRECAHGGPSAVEPDDQDTHDFGRGRHSKAGCRSTETNGWLFACGPGSRSHSRYCPTRSRWEPPLPMTSKQRVLADTVAPGAGPCALW